MTPAVGSLGSACSGISKLAEAQGPPRRSDVTDSSRECFAFLFLAVVRSFPASRGKNTVGLFSGAFGSRARTEPNRAAEIENTWRGRSLRASLGFTAPPSSPLCSIPEITRTERRGGKKATAHPSTSQNVLLSQRITPHPNRRFY